MHIHFFTFCFSFNFLKSLTATKLAVCCNSEWTQQLELDFCGPVPGDLEAAPLAVWLPDAVESLNVSLFRSSLHEQKPRPLPDCPTTEWPMCAGSCQAADYFVQPFKKRVAFLKQILSASPLLVFSVCIPVQNSHCCWQTVTREAQYRSSHVPSTVIEKRLQRTALIGLRSWFTARN